MALAFSARTMRAAGAKQCGLTLALLLVALSPPAQGAPSKKKDDRKWCLMCHREPAYAAFKDSAHADLLCRDCHENNQFNPHEPVEEFSGDLTQLKPFAKSDPVALAACAGCHEDMGTSAELMPHGRADGALKPPLPYCLDCHGEPHQIQKVEDLPQPQRRLAENATCTACHGNPERMDGGTLAIGIEPVETYADSMHLRKVLLGSANAPGCVDCHGGHHTADLRKAPEQACNKCHEGATAAFASLVTHKPVTAAQKPVSFWTQKFFAWLTFLTILGLLGHISLDITHSLGARRGRPGK